MAEQLTIHTGTRIEVREATDIEWWAYRDDEPRHAFPRREEGFPPPSICGLRWTVMYGHHGASWCEACVAGLRERIRSAHAALALVEREELEAGDFYAYPEAAS